MKDKLVKGITPGGKRTILGEALPLDTPFLIQIFPVYGCNFKCEYCLHALSREEHGYISDQVFMDLSLYKKCIDDMTKFRTKLKMLRFAGIGEPLLHKDIVEMIRYAKLKSVADSVDIVTNGALLNEKLSLGFIDAGLDKLRISIQGVSKDKYKILSNTDIDFNKFIENIRFFYENRKKTKVYIKIIDCAISDKNEEKMFFDAFTDICDSIAIEHLTPTVEGIDYNTIANGKEITTTQSGNSIIDTEICPQPFYMMQINPDGNIVPCCSMSYPDVFGNALEESIQSIWNGKKLSNFRRLLLEGVKATGGICSVCSLYKYGLFEEDRLDDYVEILKGVYK